MDLNNLLVTMSLLKGIERRTMLIFVDRYDQHGTDLENLYKFLKDKKVSGYMQGITLDELTRCSDRAKELLALSAEKGILCINRKDDRYPKNFMKHQDAPPFFFAKGNIDCLNNPSIAVIGTRQSSQYGEKMGRKIGAFLAMKGITVVSGLALGSDAAGHQGCVNVRKPTIAILANGLDTVHPVQNTKLAQEILKTGGCLISEYHIGDKANRFSLVDRDRLQACLSNGLIVIETGEKGGTLHAFNRARRDNKPVACVAYNEDHYRKNPNSRGNQKFILENVAYSITDEKSIDDFIRKIKFVDG